MSAASGPDLPLEDPTATKNTAQQAATLWYGESVWAQQGREAAWRVSRAEHCQWGPTG